MENNKLTLARECISHILGSFAVVSKANEELFELLLGNDEYEPVPISGTVKEAIDKLKRAEQISLHALTVDDIEKTRRDNRETILFRAVCEREDINLAVRICLALLQSDSEVAQ